MDVSEVSLSSAGAYANGARASCIVYSIYSRYCIGVHSSHTLDDRSDTHFITDPYITLRVTPISPCTVRRLGTEL